MKKIQTLRKAVMEARDKKRPLKVKLYSVKRFEPYFGYVVQVNNNEFYLEYTADFVDTIRFDSVQDWIIIGGIEKNE